MLVKQESVEGDLHGNDHLLIEFKNIGKKNSSYVISGLSIYKYLNDNKQVKDNKKWYE